MVCVMRRLKAIICAAAILLTACAENAQPFGEPVDSDFPDFPDYIYLYYLTAEADYDSATEMITISWESFAETGSFEILHSNDNKDFQSLAVLEETTTEGNYYQHQTDGADFVINYFKVVQIVDEEIVAESDVCYAIWSPDGVCWTDYTREWTIDSDSELLAEINNDNPHYQLSVSIEAAGVPDIHLNVGESGYSYVMQSDSILGIVPELFYPDNLAIESVIIRFEVAEKHRTELGIFPGEPEFTGIKRLNISMWCEEVNMSLPIETQVDVENNVVYAVVDRVGTFCLEDMEKWFGRLTGDYEPPFEPLPQTENPDVLITIDEFARVTRPNVDSYHNLGWRILHNGQEVLSRNAAGELSYTYHNISPGIYEIYLDAFINGKYTAISNIVSYSIDDAGNITIS